MILTRKGEPLINVLKGLAAVAVWGAVAVTGTNLLLEFSDSYSTWVLTAGLDGNIDQLPERMLGMLALSPGLGLVLIFSPLVSIAMLAQLVLLMFRNGAIIILTGLLQLAAAGSFTTGTSGWLRKVLSWHLALILYKPVAATIYAIAFMLIGEQGNDLQVWLTGIGMLGMTLVALPAMLRFLSWTVGGVQSGSGSMGMLAAAGAAGMHGAASLRGVTDHARDMERRYGSSGSPSGGTSSGSATVTPGTPPPPTYTGPPAGTTPAASTGTSASVGAGAGTAGTAAASTGAAGAAAGAGGAAAGGAATAGAAAATGPAAPVVAGVVAVGQATVGVARKGADTVTQGGAR
jgi:hypothetical protein